MRTLVVLTLAVPTLATAQSVVVPNTSANVSSTLVLNNPMREVGNPRTYMMGINGSQLAGIPVGSLIVGISMRAAHTTGNPASWPPADVLFNDYEVTLGSCLPPASWTNGFQSNFTGTPVLARDGAMVVPAGTYANVNASPTPNPWGEFYWDFQVPFVYPGGDLAILMTHPGSTASTSISSSARTRTRPCTGRR